MNLKRNYDNYYDPEAALSVTEHDMDGWRLTFNEIWHFNSGPSKRNTIYQLLCSPSSGRRK